MDKNAIKKYAVWARRELIERVSQRAMIYGITAKDAGDPNAESVNGHLLSQAEKRQRQALIRNIKTKGYEQVMEEVAYTWFNRFAALRFMEVNGYLPSHIRVFTNDAGEFKPQILAEAIHLELDGLDMNKVYELESANKSEELFKYLLIVQCNALNSILPGMFQRIEDYTELLLPDYLLREGSVIEQMVTTIPEEDWTDQVQIIGWLYQYYNTEPKDKVFADLKKNIKITKENIPAATQLFTPDWIVHYMVENSLGRLWLEGHPNDALKSEWKYYLDEAEQEPEVQAQLATIRKEYAALKPEEIRVIDPCMGSGHILCVLFDVLVRIYEDYGYTAREAAVKIVENNLWGLDIDERAAQLSYFAVMMKARQYDRRFFTRKVQPHVYAIEESNGITSAPMHDMGLNLSHEEYGKASKEAMRLVEEMHDAKEYGSIIHATPCDWNLLRRFAMPREEEGQLHLDIHGEIEASAQLQRLINIGEALSQKYHSVVTNPPYMGSNNFNPTLSTYIKDQYAIVKEDTYSCFIERCTELCITHYFVSMITMESWMFNTTFSKFRSKLLNDRLIVNMIHMPYLGKGGTSLGISFGTAAFTLCKVRNMKYLGYYNCVRYFETDEDGVPINYPTKNEKENAISHDSLSKLPDSVISYWATNHVIDIFVEEHSLADKYGDARQGLKTSDNKRFLRLWSEVEYSHIGFDCANAEVAAESGCKWFPYNKGGKYRKWSGNDDYVIDWSDNGNPIKQAVCKRYPYLKGNYSFVVKNESKYFLEQVTWTTLTSGKLSFRFKPSGYLFDGTGSSIFNSEHKVLEYLLGLLNSSVGEYLLGVLGQTMSYEVGMISKIPVIYKPAEELSARINRCIELCREDWNDYEVSWEFKKHPLIGVSSRIEEALDIWVRSKKAQRKELIDCETWINKYFAEVYQLSSLDVQVQEDEYVSIQMPTRQNMVITLIEYAVGCMFGRYSLDSDGIVFAGGNFRLNPYLSFMPDRDGIIPVVDDEYFEDDVVGRFVEFIKVAYGNDTLEENLRFIADTIGKKGSSREVIRDYFINDFFVNHCSMYSAGMGGKRPIYWLFDSGKKNGFKCLIYMHRYQPDTIARIRTDYVHEQQSRYRTAISDLEQRINGVSTSERVKLSKRLAKLQAQAEELRIYEEKIHHLADQMIKIDLDDGVKHNYEIFKDVLAKIK